MKTLNNAVARVLKALCRKLGLNLSFGSEPATDGQTIWLPDVPSMEYLDVIIGFGIHEGPGHVLNTDFGLVRKLADMIEAQATGTSLDQTDPVVQEVQTWSPFEAALLNVVEDPAIESEAMESRPGYTYYLNAAVEHFRKTDKWGHVSAEDPPGAIIQGKSLYWLRTRLLGQDLQDYLDEAEAAMAAVFPESVNTRLEALLRKVSGWTETMDSVRIVKGIVAMLKDEAEKERQRQEEAAQQNQGSAQGQDPSGGQGQSESQGDEESGTGQASGQSGGDSKDGAQDGAQGESEGDQQQSSSTSSGQGEQADGGAGRSGDQSSGNSSSASNGAGNGSEELIAALEAALGADEGDLLEDVFEQFKQELSSNPQYRSNEIAIPECGTHMGNSKWAEGALRGVAQTTSKLRSQLAKQLDSARNERSALGLRGNRLDARRLSRIDAGDFRVFRKKHEVSAPNTAVHILVDKSDSMVGRRIDVASQAAMAIALALEGIPGINPAVTYFGNSTTRPVFAAVRHGEKVRQCVGRFGIRTDGGTPMTEALWYAADEVMRQKEPRKMIIVITDGVPWDVASTLDVIERCENTGVEVLAVGIQCADVKGIFKDCIVINDVDDLVNTLFAVMRDKLVA